MPPRRSYDSGFGSYEAGNLPWRNQQLFDLAERISEELSQKQYKQLPSVVAPQNARQKKVSTNLDALLGEHQTKRKAATNPYSVAQNEINKALNTKTHAGIKPALEAAARSPFDSRDQQFLDEFQQKYGDIGKATLDEMNENYLTHLAPKVQGAAIGGRYHNNYNTVQHQKNAVLRGLHKDVNRNLSHLKARALEHGLEESHKHKIRGLEAAQLGSNVQEKEKESAFRGAQALQDAERGQHIHDISMLDQERKAGADEQAREEALLRETHERAREQQEFNTHKLAQEAQLTMGLPATHVSQVQKPAEPRPVNPAEISAGLMGQVVGMMHHNKPTTHKKGGSVDGNDFHDFQKLVAKSIVKRRNGGSIKAYAPGGAVSYVPNDGSMTPEIQQQMAILQQMQQNQGNPMGHAFSNMGAHMLANSGSGKSPYASFGEGLQQFNATRQHHENHAQSMREKQIHLLSSVHQSRLRQQALVHNFEHQKNSEAEQRRVHDAQIAHYGAQNKLLAAQAAQYAPGSQTAIGGSGYLPKGVKETTEHKERAKRNAAILKETDTQLKAAQEGKRTLGRIKQLSNELDTGPTKGAIANLPIVGPIIGGWLGLDPAKLSEFQAGTKKLALEQEAAHPGVKGKALMEAYQETKPHEKRPKETNVKITEKIGYGFDRAEAEAKFIRKFIKEGHGDAVSAKEAFAEMYPEGDEPLETYAEKKVSHSGSHSKAASMSSDELMRIATS